MNILFSAASGILLALAFPKANLYWLAWVGLVPFFLALSRSKNYKESLLCGFFFGLFFFGIHLFWINSLFQFAGWFVALGWIALTLVQVLYVILFVIVLRAGRVSSPFLIALFWVLCEWLRTLGPVGVTVGQIGYTQVRFLSFLQIASFASVYGVNFVLAFFNASLAQFVKDERKWKSLIVALVLVVVCCGYGYFVMHQNALPAGKTVKLSLIQPNIKQKDKIDMARVIPIFDVHENLSRQAMRENPDIIIWPETAIFSYLLSDPVLFPRLKNLAMASNAWLIIGTPYFDGKDKIYNSIVSISPAGEIVSRYDKQRLVPFGEYLPFREILYPFLKGVGYFDEEYNSNTHPIQIFAGGLKIAAAICFESTFHDTIKKRVRNDSDLILNVTNDAWFDSSSVVYYHANIGVLRAIENRKHFVQVANTGISEVIDPFGRVLERSKINQQEILVSEISLP